MSFAKLKWVWVAAVACSVAACGGGGSGGSDGGGAQNQTIAFATPGSVSATAGSTFTNAASGGGGTGSITYTSGTLSVATVNASTGVVSAIAVGSSTITATKAASAGFNSATAAYTVSVTAGSQTISFAQAGGQQVLAGATVNNVASGGAGTGSIAYSSSNTNSVTVNAASGVAAAVGAGTATITATKAADANFSQAQATYNINVVESTNVNAWIGASNTNVTFALETNGARFLRSRDRNCSYVTVTVCTNGVSDTISGAPASSITDLAATHSNIGYYVLQTDTLRSAPITVTQRRFSPRIGHTAQYFNGKYWMLGGAFGNDQNLRADYWSSTDGKVWDQETVPFALANRFLHQHVVYDNKMWIIGGLSNGAQLADVWSTTDGLNWQQVTQLVPLPASYHFLNAATFNNAIWVVVSGNVYSSTDGATWTLQTISGGPVGGAIARQNATLTAYNGKLWYIGGASSFVPAAPSGTFYNDIWSSPDGLNWSVVTPSGGAQVGNRLQHSAFVLNNRLWVFGGRTISSGVLSMVGTAWSTTDGTNWTQEATDIEADRSYFSTHVQHTGSVVLVGGLQRIYSNGVYSTNDGSTFTELTSNTGFAARSAPEAIAFNGELWLIGGVTFRDGATNEILRSADGVNWSRVSPTGGSIFTRRVLHKLLVFNNRLWVIGGWNEPSAGGDGTKYADVWSTADGVAWTQATSNAAFGARTGFGATVFDAGAGPRMWVIGGEDASLTSRNDVWSSSNGADWIQETAAANFTPRSGQRAVTINNAMWLIGGGTPSPFTPLDEVLISTNGINWTPAPFSSARFSPRIGHGVVVHSGRVFVIGGNNAGPYPSPATPTDPNFNDVWSSADGANWTPHTAGAPFEKRSSFGLASLSGELWLINGFGFDRHSEVWRSPDGANWRVLFNQSIRMR